MLEKDGYDVQAYNDPRLALKSFKRDLFRLALLDIRMPHMDGFKLFEQIRKKDDKVRVYFMTAFEVYRDQFGQLPSSDIQHIIEKPVDMIELKQILTRSSDFLMSLYNSKHFMMGILISNSNKS